MADQNGLVLDRVEATLRCHRADGRRGKRSGRYQAYNRQARSSLLIRPKHLSAWEAVHHWEHQVLAAGARRLASWVRKPSDRRLNGILGRRRQFTPQTTLYCRRRSVLAVPLYAYMAPATRSTAVEKSAFGSPSVVAGSVNNSRFSMARPSSPVMARNMIAQATGSSMFFKPCS
jgi:hypothetical protein